MHDRRLTPFFSRKLKVAFHVGVNFFAMPATFAGFHGFLGLHVRVVGCRNETPVTQSTESCE